MSEERSTIGRFELAAELGRGSMGIVHRAHDPVVGRDVAIKRVLLPNGLSGAGKEEYLQRFQREARAAGCLSHPGIVTIYDLESRAGDDSPFIAMEYVEGPTLHELICREGALNPDWVLSIGEFLADALQAAHAAGIIHRDLKPANILVRSADGIAKISDFGVARVNSSELTEAGTTYGSPAYIAPERLRGRSTDARSDLFSLAVILYEALCGVRPFGGEDFATTCSAILHETPPSIRSLSPELVPTFDRFFETALAKDPELRFQDAAALRDALRVLRREQEVYGRRLGAPARPAPGTGGTEADEAGRRAILSGLGAAIDGATETPGRPRDGNGKPRRRVDRSGANDGPTLDPGLLRRLAGGAALAAAGRRPGRPGAALRGAGPRGRPLVLVPLGRGGRLGTGPGTVAGRRCARRPAGEGQNPDPGRDGGEDRRPRPRAAGRGGTGAARSGHGTGRFHGQQEDGAALSPIAGTERSCSSRRLPCAEGDLSYRLLPATHDGADRPRGETRPSRADHSQQHQVGQPHPAPRRPADLRHGAGDRGAPRRAPVQEDDGSGGPGDRRQDRDSPGATHARRQGDEPGPARGKRGAARTHRRARPDTTARDRRRWYAPHAYRQLALD